MPAWTGAQKFVANVYKGLADIAVVPICLPTTGGEIQILPVPSG